MRLIASIPSHDPVDLTVLKIVATIFFFTLFVVILLRLVLARSGRFDSEARIPLEDDVVTPRATSTDDSRTISSGSASDG